MNTTTSGIPLLSQELKTNEKSTASDSHTLPLSYFDLLDEKPEYSEAAILLDDKTIEYCYIKIAQDGSQYFGFNYSLPSSPEYTDLFARHKFSQSMEANTYERYPSGKIVLSKGGKILETNLPQVEKTHV